MKRLKALTALVMSIIMIVANMTGFALADAENLQYVTLDGCFVGPFADEAKVFVYGRDGARYACEVIAEEDYGVYSTEVVPGKYDIVITCKGCLPVNMENILVGSSGLTVKDIPLVSGDLNGDGAVDTLDYAVILRGFSEEPEFEQIRKIADLNGDGLVLVDDISELKSNIGRKKQTIKWTNVMKLQCDYRNNPLGMDETDARLSWVLDSTKRGQKQTAYEVGIATTKEDAENGNFDVWYSAKVYSDLNYAVIGAENVGEVEGEPVEFCGFEPATRYYWTVTVYDKDGEAVKASDVAEFETGLFGDFGNDNMWIYHSDASKADLPAVLFRKQFTLEQSLSMVESARLYSTAAGNQIMYMNGLRASDDYMAPGKSQYTTILYYQTYDVKDILIDGDNTVAAEVGQGWYNAGAVQAKYGKNVGLKAKLVITFSDGTQQIIDTDSTWLSTNEGPTYTNRYYIGQKVDGRKYIENWNTNNCTSDKWQSVVAAKTFTPEDAGADITDKLVAENMNPVRVYKEIEAISVTNPRNGVFVYDFGVNMAGTSRITAKAEVGTEMIVRYGEVLSGATVYDAYEHNGRDSYIFRGDTSGETVEFDLVYHGFRYIQLEGLSEAPALSDVKALFLSSDVDLTMEFETSNEKLNILEENGRNSLKSNYVSAITDCPTREKNTWSGDSNLSAGMASFYANVYNHFRNFEQMFASSQYHDGAVPELAPSITPPSATAKGTSTKTPAVYSDVIVQVPYEMYLAYGDKRIILEYYDNMTAWMDFLINKKIYKKGDSETAYLSIPYYLDPEKADWIRVDGNYGDHLSRYRNIQGRGYREKEACTTNYVWRDISYAEVGTAYAAYSCMMMAEMAEIIGKTEDAEYYKEIHAKLAEGWRNNFLREDGYTAVSDGVTTSTTNGGVTEYHYDYNVTRLVNGVSCENLGAQTSYAYGLAFNLYENEEKARLAAGNLATIVEREGFAMTTGQCGMRQLFDTLTQFGYYDHAMRIMEREEFPSFLHMVNEGATSMWEGYWNSMSCNHFSFGQGIRWMYENITGIRHGYDAQNAGFRHFELAPGFSLYDGATVTWAKAKFDSVNGTIESAWELSEDGNIFTYNCTVPANTSATLILPIFSSSSVIKESGSDVSLSEGVEHIKTEGGKAYFEITSGVYSFKVENNIEEITKRLNGLDILCIGDSLTYGAYDSHGLSGKAYPAFLAEMTGANTINKGVSASNPTTYWNNHLKKINFDDVDIVLIMLGTNGGLTDTIGTDIVGDDYNNYADTHTGNYGKMIEYIKEQTSHETMIVLMTPPKVSPDVRPISQMEGAVTVVKKLAEKYGLAVIDNYNNCGINHSNIEKYMPHDGIHCVGEGYELIASYVAKKTAEYYNDFYPYDYTLRYTELSEEEGDYYYLGRWYEQESEGVLCKGTISPGAEIHFKVKNTENVWITTHSTHDMNPYIAVSIDGKIPVRIETPLSGNTLIAQGLTKEKEHTVRIIVDGLHTYGQNKWVYGYGFNFAKAVVDEAGEIAGIKPDHKVIAYFGDSITEGCAAFVGSSPLPSDNSHTHAYPFYTSALLGAVTYNAGYGGSGVTHGGTGAVPKCLTVIDYILEDKTFDMPTPDVIVINHGHNDRGYTAEEIATFKAEYSAVLDRLHEKFPKTPIIIVPAYSGSKFASQLKEIIAGRERVYIVDNSGWKYTTTDGTHPDSDGARAISKKLAPEIKRILGQNFFN
ncbi:MAG: hypothetical protein E7583_02505 [Ruminococcaceae bacterium]|nr:hypothetical protein [Oscillospiraceae bacterium]